MLVQYMNALLPFVRVTVFGHRIRSRPPICSLMALMQQGEGLEGGGQADADLAVRTYR